jgi:hypothetical protein
MSNKYIIRIADPNEISKWDKFVTSLNNGSIFHTTPFLYNNNNNIDIIIILDGNNEICGGIPFELKTYLGRFKAAIMPHLIPYCGPLIKFNSENTCRRNTQIKKIHTLISEFLIKNYSYVSFFFYPDRQDLQPYLWNNFGVKLKYTYRIKNEDFDRAISFSEHRSDVRKAQKDGYKVCFDCNIDDIIYLTTDSYKRQGLNSTHGNIKNIYNEIIKNNNNCFNAKIITIINDKFKYPVCGLLIVWDKIAVYSLLIGKNIKDKHRGTGPLLIVSTIQYVKNNLKVRYFDFEGSSNQNIEKYFRKFGGELTPVLGVKYQNLFFRVISCLRRLLKIVY